jgi:purine-binding chemotaxis protein CheW
MNVASAPTTLLIFDLDEALFGVDATQVRESVWLPRLTPVEEVPPYIVGIFSLRGQIVPVTDLHLRFGHPTRPHRISDRVVVLEMDHLLMGLIVSDVREVVEIQTEGPQTPKTSAAQTPSGPSLIRARVRVGDDIVMLLDARQLMLLPGNISPAATDQEVPAHSAFPQATAEENLILRERARMLMEGAAEKTDASHAFAVVELGGEYFGIDLNEIQEFCTIVRPCPIPCCPPHILGAMNIRGNLYTLLDLREALKLPGATQASDKAVIVRAAVPSGTGYGDQALGVALDQVHGVIYLCEADMRDPPAALRDQNAAAIKGTALYADRTLTILNLSALLAQEEWIVNETV